MSREDYGADVGVREGSVTPEYGQGQAFGIKSHSIPIPTPPPAIHQSEKDQFGVTDQIPGEDDLGFIAQSELFSSVKDDFDAVTED